MKMNRVLFEEANGGDGGTAGGTAGGGSAAAAGSSMFNGSATGAASAGSAGAGAGQASASGQSAAGGQGNGTAAASSGAAPAWFAKLFTTDGKIDKTAYDSAPDNVKKFRSSLEQYETPEALFHALGHNKSLVGAKALSRLAPDAPQEAKDQQAKVLREVLGVPDKPEGYGLKKPDNLPDGVQWDDAVVGKYAAVMHKHNLSPEAVKELVALNLEVEGGRAAAGPLEAQKQMQAEFTALDAGLPAGVTRDQYLARSTQGVALASKLTGISVEELKAGTRTARDVKLFHAMAEMAGEDKLAGAAASTGGVDHEAKIKELMNSKEYMDGSESVRGPVMAEITRLTRLQLATRKK